MISVSVTRKGPLRRLADGLEAEADKAAYRSAEYFPRTVQRNIYQKVGPEGRSQKANAQSTINRKGHAHPLIGVTRTLSNPQSWPKPRRIKRGEYAADPPPGYRAVIDGLQDRGYRVIGFSADFIKYLRAQFTEELRAALRKWGG